MEFKSPRVVHPKAIKNFNEFLATLGIYNEPDGHPDVDKIKEVSVEQRTEDDKKHFRELREKFNNEFGEECEILDSDDINFQGQGGYTLLFDAVVDADIEGVISLLARGARIDIEDNGGKTVIHKAKRLLEMSSSDEERQKYSDILTILMEAESLLKNEEEMI